MTATDTQTYGYMPVPEIVTRLGLYVTGAGTAVVPPNSSYPHQLHPELYDFKWRTGRVLPEFQFVFIAEGQGEFESKATGLQPVKAGTVIQLFPDVWHRYRPDPSTGWTEYWISFGGELMFRWHERGIFREATPLAVLRQPEEALYQYQRVIDVVRNRPEHSATLMTSRAMGVIATTLERHAIVDSEQPVFVSSNDRIVDEARQIIWNHSHQRVTVDIIAKKVGVTRRTLERHFREHSDRTVLQELVACRIHRAKRLLVETNVPIKHVAHSAGFTSVSNLCKVFRREVNLTPGEFRDGKTSSSNGRGRSEQASPPV